MYEIRVFLGTCRKQNVYLAFLALVIIFFKDVKPLIMIFTQIFFKGKTKPNPIQFVLCPLGTFVELIVDFQSEENIIVNTFFNTSFDTLFDSRGFQHFFTTKM